MIALYYYENLTLREIGEVLGVTESRVSQLHTKAVLRLRLAPDGRADAESRRPPGGVIGRSRSRSRLAGRPPATLDP